MEPKFKATHIVQHDDQTYDVMLLEKLGYTQDEWNNGSQAEYEVNDDGEWFFQGEPFNGSVISFDWLANALGYEGMFWDDFHGCYSGFGSSDPTDRSRDNQGGYLIGVNHNDLMRIAERLLTA